MLTNRFNIIIDQILGLNRLQKSDLHRHYFCRLLWSAFHKNSAFELQKEKYDAKMSEKGSRKQLNSSPGKYHTKCQKKTRKMQNSRVEVENN